MMQKMHYVHFVQQMQYVHFVLCCVQLVALGMHAAAGSCCGMHLRLQERCLVLLAFNHSWTLNVFLVLPSACRTYLQRC